MVFWKVKNKFKNLAYSLFGQDLEQRVKEEVAKEARVDPKILDQYKVGVGELGYVCFLQKIGNGIKRVCGKVLGAYDRFQRKIYLDWLAYLGKYFKPFRRLFVLTYAHELWHALQHYFGKLKSYRSGEEYLRNYERDENEKEARKVSEKIVDRICGPSLGSLSLYS